jgi:hypothetical protein
MVLLSPVRNNRGGAMQAQWSNSGRQSGQNKRGVATTVLTLAAVNLVFFGGWRVALDAVKPMAKQVLSTQAFTWLYPEPELTVPSSTDGKSLDGELGAFRRHIGEPAPIPQ